MRVEFELDDEGLLAPDDVARWEPYLQAVAANFEAAFNHGLLILTVGVTYDEHTFRYREPTDLDAPVSVSSVDTPRPEVRIRLRTPREQHRIEFKPEGL